LEFYFLVKIRMLQPDTGVEMMAHIALTSLCEDWLATTLPQPIALLPI
jgi:hypothetical protein